VFSSQGIVFTRVVNYDFNQPDFLEKYEHDIYSTFEYLKRIFPNLSMSELDIVNIFSDKVLSLIEKTNNPELNFVNYKVADAAAKSGYGSIIESDSGFCDFLISKIFSKKKKILKFTTPKMNVLEKFFLTIKASYYLNLVLVVLIIATGVATLLSQDKIAQSIEAAESIRYQATEELAKLKKLAFEGGKISDEDSSVTPERVIDFGKIEEGLVLKDADFISHYNRLKFLKDMDVKLESFNCDALNFNSKSPAPNTLYQIGFAGKLFNKTGDIDDLFREFDALTGEIKKNFPSNQVKYEELPRTLDFSTKYYKYPVNFTISGGALQQPQNPTGSSI
jgi:hypothetical protein